MNIQVYEGERPMTKDGYIVGSSEMLVVLEGFDDMWRWGLVTAFLKREGMIVNKDIYRVSRVFLKSSNISLWKSNMFVWFWKIARASRWILTPILVDDSDFDQYFWYLFFEMGWNHHLT